MAERLLGFLAWTEMRRLARSGRFLVGRVGLALAAGWLALAQMAILPNGRLNTTVLAAQVGGAALLAILAGGPLLVVLGFDQLRSTRMMELLLAAGVGRRGLVAGVWYGRLLSLLLLAAGGVGALASLLVFGGLDVRMLLDLAAFLAVAALSATALALPAAARCTQRRSAGWLAYAPVLLLHVAPNLLGSVLLLLGEGLAGLRLANDPHRNAAVLALLPIVSHVTSAGAWTIFPEIVGPAATDPAGALRLFAWFHLPIAGLCFLWAAWTLRLEPNPPARRWFARRTRRMADDDEPIAWFLAKFTRFGWGFQAVTALVLGGMFFWSLCATGLPTPAAGVVALGAGWFGAALGSSLGAAFALANAAPLSQALAGVPIEPDEVRRMAVVQFRRVPLALAGAFTLAAAVAVACQSTRSSGNELQVAGPLFVVLSVALLLTTHLLVGLGAFAGARAETAIGAAGRLAIFCFCFVFLLVPVVLLAVLVVAQAAMLGMQGYVSSVTVILAVAGLFALVALVCADMIRKNTVESLTERFYPTRTDCPRKAPPRAAGP